MKSNKINSLGKILIKKNVLIGSSHVGQINVTLVNEEIKDYNETIVYNLAIIHDTPKDRLKTITSVIAMKPDLVLYGISVRDVLVNKPTNIILPDPKKVLHGLVPDAIKEQIPTNALRDSLSYIESRFKNIQLVQKQLIEFKELLNMIEELSITKVEERNAIEFYKIRSLRTLPPDLQAQESLYVVMCRICWNHYSGLDKIQAIKHIRHLKNCLYDESQISRCIEVIPPKNLKGKS